MLPFEWSGSRSPNNAHQIAHAALLLAEQAYAQGKAEDAAYLVDVAHRLFGASMEAAAFATQH